MKAPVRVTITLAPPAPSSTPSVSTSSAPTPSSELDELLDPATYRERTADQ